MFLLAELNERIRILPQHFSLDTRHAIIDELNKQLANKVLLDVGLCIGVHSIVSLNDALLAPGDGAAHTDVVFKVIVFRPQIGSVINGKIRSCTREGVFITLGFFDDIFIPQQALQHPSRYEEAEQAWIWSYPMADDESHDLYMDIGEPIRFRIVDEVFLEPSPVGPPNIEVYGIQTSVVSTIPQDKREPYKIIASIAESGLGVWSWWSQMCDNAEEAGDEEENAEEDKKTGITKEGDEKKVAGATATTDTKDTIAKIAAAKVAAALDSAAKANAAKDSSARIAAAKDTAAKIAAVLGNSVKDAPTKDSAAKMTAAKATAAKDTAAKDIAAKDATTKDTAAKDTVVKGPVDVASAQGNDNKEHVEMVIQNLKLKTEPE